MAQINFEGKKGKTQLSMSWRKRGKKGGMRTKERALEVFQVGLGGYPSSPAGQALIPNWTLVTWEGHD